MGSNLIVALSCFFKTVGADAAFFVPAGITLCTFLITFTFGAVKREKVKRAGRVFLCFAASSFLFTFTASLTVTLTDGDYPLLILPALSLTQGLTLYLPFFLFSDRALNGKKTAEYERFIRAVTADSGQKRQAFSPAPAFRGGVEEVKSAGESEKGFSNIHAEENYAEHNRYGEERAKFAGEINLSHVKNVLEKVSSYNLSFSDRQRVNELKAMVSGAERGERGLKEKINEGLNSLLKIMAKYGV